MKGEREILYSFKALMTSFRLAFSGLSHGSLNSRKCTAALDIN